MLLHSIALYRRVDKTTRHGDTLGVLPVHALLCCTLLEFILSGLVILWCSANEATNPTVKGYGLFPHGCTRVGNARIK